jgi:hypothetical protein
VRCLRRKKNENMITSQRINRYDEPRPLVRDCGKCAQYSSRKTSNEIKDLRLWSIYSPDSAG